MTWEQCETANNAPKLRNYRAKSVVYDGVYHEHPRFSIWVEPKGPVDTTGTVGGKIFISNPTTGEFLRIFGVNHWYWQDHRVVIFPAYHEKQYKEELLTTVQRICAPGTEFAITVCNC